MSNELQVVAPLSGEIIDITQVPDPVFSQKTMGEGFGIANPTSDDIVVPVDGRVVLIAKTKHAVGITADNGLQFVLHLGIDTVELKGEPFELFVKKGQTVRAGDRLGTMNLAAIKRAGKDVTSVLAITNSRRKLATLDILTGVLTAGDPVATARPASEKSSTQPPLVTLHQAPSRVTASGENSYGTDGWDGGDTGDAWARRDAEGEADAEGMAGFIGHAGVEGRDSTGTANHWNTASTRAAQPARGNGARGNEAHGQVSTSQASSLVDPATLGPYGPLAQNIVTAVGGLSNITSVTHCITRLRFYLKQESLADDAAIKDMDHVVDVIKAGGQYQVVIGPEVEDVYPAVEKLVGGKAAGEVPADAGVDKEKPEGAWGWIKWGFSSLIGVITGSMIPVIGLLAASGMIKGVLSLLTTFELITTESNTYALINAMSDAVFFFLPIFVGFTAARRLGANQVIVAIIGGVLCYPTLVEMSSADPTTTFLGIGLNSDFFGIPFYMASYSYSIFPMIVAAWLASVIEPKLKQWIPATIRMIFMPLIEVVVISLIILLVLGPVVMFISGGIASGIEGIYNLSPTIAGLVIGGFYQCLVIFGLHWAVIPLVAQDIAVNGNSYLNAIISATMVAQGGAVLAVFFKSKLLKIKELSGSAAIAAFCGITEPAMYGVNLKYGRTFIMASIGGAVGGLLTGILAVNMWGFTGSLIGFMSFVNPDGLDFSFWGFWIASLAAIVVAFSLTWFFGFKDADVEHERVVEKVRLGRREPVAK